MAYRKPPINIPEPDISNPREAVSSQAASLIGYDADNEILYVTFRPTGMSYQYLRVPESEYEALMAAASRGTHINKVIKPNYECVPEV